MIFVSTRARRTGNVRGSARQHYYPEAREVADLLGFTITECDESSR